MTIFERGHGDTCVNCERPFAEHDGENCPRAEKGGRIIIRSEVNVAAIQINEVAEVAPHEAGYRQYALTGRDFAAWKVAQGVMVRVGNEEMLLEHNDANALRDWIEGACPR